MKRKGRVADASSPWMIIRRALGTIVAEAGLSPDDVIVKEAMSELEVMFRSLQQRVYVTKRGNLAKRTELLEACRLLMVKVPPLGKPVNLRIALRQRGLALKQHHPDVAVGDPALHRQLFQQIADAYDFLRGYNESLEKTGAIPHG